MDKEFLEWYGRQNQERIDGNKRLNREMNRKALAIIGAYVLWVAVVYLVVWSVSSLYR